MELTQLMYFIEVAQQQSISAAAKTLHITQPALSKSIGKLEDEIGLSLFDRVGKNIILNKRGEYFLTVAKQSVDCLLNARMALEGLNYNNENTINIGLLCSPSTITDCISLFKGKHPEAIFHLDLRNKDVDEKSLIRFDILLYPEKLISHNVRGIKVTEEKTGIIVHPEHPLANRKTAALSEFKDDVFVFLGFMDNSYKYSYDLCTQAGFIPNIQYTTTSVVSQKSIISHGLAIGFSTQSNGNEITSDDGLKFIELQPNPQVQAVKMTFKPDSLLSPLAMRFRDFMLDYFHINLSARELQAFTLKGN